MPGPKRRDPFERWLEKVEKTDGCWLWTASKTEAGYGRFGRLQFGRTDTVFAHRFAYEHYKGPIPEGLIVRHLCHEPACVNPAHLEVGTHYDNVQDCIRAGRDRRGVHRGEVNGRARLSAADVLRIRRDGRDDLAVAQAYGVGKTTVADIRRRKTWRHLPDGGDG